VAEGEIRKELGGEVKRRGRGIVVLRVPEITADLLRLRSPEDVFCIDCGSDPLTYRDRAFH